MSAIDISTTVTLRIIGDDVDPDIITREMQISPDAAHRKGDVHGVRTPVVRKQGYWSVVSSSHIDAAADTNEHIQWLVGMVAGKGPIIASYQRRGVTVDVWVGLHTSAGHGGPALRADVLAQLAGLGLDVNLDLYPLG